MTEVELLAEEPFPYGSEKLVKSERTYRIHVGDYRVVYEVSGFLAIFGGIETGANG